MFVDGATSQSPKPSCINLMCKNTVWESKLNMEKSAVSPKSVKLPREPCAAGFREGVSNVELHLGWDQVLVGQKL